MFDKKRSRVCGVCDIGFVVRARQDGVDSVSEGDEGYIRYVIYMYLCIEGPGEGQGATPHHEVGQRTSFGRIRALKKLNFFGAPYQLARRCLSPRYPLSQPQTAERNL